MTKRSRLLGLSVIASAATVLSFAGCVVEGQGEGEDGALEPVESAEEAVYTCPMNAGSTLVESGDCHGPGDMTLDKQKCAAYCGAYCTPTVTKLCKPNVGPDLHADRTICSCAPAFDCADGLQSGGETDVDCGGPCGACGAGLGCATAADCQSGVCAGGVCQAPACNDGVLNGSESDVDCGGGACTPCATGQACALASDCASGVCNAGLCLAPSCNDGLQNGAETGVDCGGPCAACGHLVINEVDYDQVSTDFAEYIEIWNPTASTVSLAQTTLVLVNGANNTTYTVVDLSSAGSLAPGQYLVVASSTVPVAAGAKVVLFAAAQDNVQNGSPDGIALVDAGVLIDALSYEGSMPAANVTGLGVVSLDEGTPTAVIDTNASVRALIRKPNGQDTNDASVDWAQTTTLTPGAANP